MAEIGIVVSMICLCTDVRSPCISEGSSEISEIVKKRRKKKLSGRAAQQILETIVLIKVVYF